MYIVTRTWYNSTYEKTGTVHFMTDSNTAIDALAAMGLTVDEVLEIDATVLGKRDKDSRVCLCGHPMARHTQVAGIVMCKPSRMDCACKRARPVIEVSDLRPFLRKTEGSGALHALTRGMAVLASNGKSAKWIIELVCDRCGVYDNKVLPCAVTQQGTAAQRSTGFDVLLCEKCRESI